jgi:ADP-heptose:LPS heptosyltransferase
MIMIIKLVRLLNTAYSFSITVLTFIFDSCVITLVRQSAHTGGVAIVRLDAIGDFILWLDAAKEFRNLYQNTTITLIANQVWSDLARLLPYWDDVIPVDRNKFTRHPLYRFQIFRTVRKRGFESVVHATYSRDYFRGDSLIRATGALQRIGSSGDTSNMTSLQKIISDRWYSKLLPATSKPLMELQRNAEFMNGLGLRSFTTDKPLLSPLTDLPDKLVIKHPYYIIFPGTSLPGKKWPTSKFGELMLKLSALNDGLAVLCGSWKERVLCDQVIAISGMKALNMAGKVSLPELVEMIRGAKYLVGNDTAAVHIAAAVGTPSVCILGGGHYGRFLPYATETDKQVSPIPITHQMDCFNCNWQCTQPHRKGDAVPCISNIRVNQVFEAVEKIRH